MLELQLQLSEKTSKYYTGLWTNKGNRRRKSTRILHKPTKYIRRSKRVK